MARGQSWEIRSDWMDGGMDGEVLLLFLSCDMQGDSCSLHPSDHVVVPTPEGMVNMAKSVITDQITGYMHPQRLNYI